MVVVTCQTIYDRNEHKAGAPPGIQVAHTFNVQKKNKNTTETLGGMEIEAGLDFLPLSFVDPGFANSYYFSQESCQRDWESVQWRKKPLSCLQKWTQDGAATHQLPAFLVALHCF